MGISGLLQFIKDASEPVNVKKYRGQTVAVDTYCWLHKGAFSCAEKLAKGEPTDQYVWYCMKFVDMLLNFGVKPVLVFDGRNLPSKQEVEKSRRERRESNLQRGRQLLREGKLSEARDCFTRCVNITPAMAHNLIKTARSRGVDCLVAPYEADAQLAFLSKSGLVQAVITEDSDLLAFGCKKVILKMDKQGNGLEIDQVNFGRCRSLANVFTEEKFRYMCILSGCDYLTNLHGIGLGKACKLLRLAKDPDITKVIRKMGQYLKMNLVVPDDYIEGFIRANNTFLYQLVFDPVRRRVVPLNPYPENIEPETLAYAGRNLGDEKGFQMALGNLDINTMKTIDDFNPDKPRPQLPKPRSRSWSEAPAPAPGGASIWTGGSLPALGGAPPPSGPPPSSTLERPPATRGRERVIGLAGLRIKRQRQDSPPPPAPPLSDQDVLLQYSSSSPKRSRAEDHPLETPSVQTRPRNRNRFATALQRRNQEEEDEDGQGTHSRFFSSTCPVAVATKSTSQVAVETKSSTPSDSDGPDAPSVETPSPPPSPENAATAITSSSSPASQGLKLFQWTGSGSKSRSGSGSKSETTSGLAALQRFHFKKETRHKEEEEEEELPESPPSQDSAYFSQSQSGSAPFSLEEELSPAHQEEDAKEVTLVTHSTTESPGALRSKVSGLMKPTLGPARVQIQTPGLVRVQTPGLARVQTLGPARASGLRRKSPGSKKNPLCSNENNPGLQTTISSLWKNFSYTKDSPKMSVLKKEPMSPVKENLPEDTRTSP